MQQVQFVYNEKIENGKIEKGKIGNGKIEKENVEKENVEKEKIDKKKEGWFIRKSRWKKKHMPWVWYEKNDAKSGIKADGIDIGGVRAGDKRKFRW